MCLKFLCRFRVLRLLSLLSRSVKPDRRVSALGRMPRLADVWVGVNLVGPAFTHRRSSARITTSGGSAYQKSCLASAALVLNAASRAVPKN
jgi:hypothetical protein